MPKKNNKQKTKVKSSLQDKYETKDGNKILLSPKVKRHLVAHPNITHDLLLEAVNKLQIEIKLEILEIEVDLQRIIGKSGRIETEPISIDDQTTFAKRLGRPNFSRVIIPQEGENILQDSTKITFILHAKNGAKTFGLTTCWIGEKSVKEPNDKSVPNNSKIQQESFDFWCKNAFIYDSEIMEKEIKESTWNLIVNGDTEDQ